MRTGIFHTWVTGATVRRPCPLSTPTLLGSVVSLVLLSLAPYTLRLHSEPSNTVSILVSLSLPRASWRSKSTAGTAQ